MEMHNSAELPCVSHYFSYRITQNNTEFLFINLEKRKIFLLIMQDVLCLMFYISCKRVQNLYLGNKTIKFVKKCNSIFRVASQFIEFHLKI